MEALTEIAAHEDIAIAVLATCLAISVSANAALFLFIGRLIKNFRADLSEAWGCNKEFSKALKSTTTDLAVIRDRTRGKAGN